jgi:hypothetical protein
MAAAQRFDVPPERLARWLARWRDAHGEVVSTEVAAAEVTFAAADGARLVCAPAFGPLPAAVRGAAAGFAPGPLLVHAERDRDVGVLLVRLGAHAAGVFAGTRLVDSKVARRLVHGRHRAGGSSARRFERRRGEQARASLDAAADVAARVLLPRLAALDAVVLGGDRRALDEVLADRRLRPLAERAEGRVLEVAEPRLDVLRATPAAFRACALRDYPPSSST